MRIRDLVELMIVVSDNTATNMLVERLGTKRIDDRLAGLKLPDTKIFRPTFRDGRADVSPELEREFGLGMTTPRQMAELMAMIAEGRAVNPEASAAMVATLRRQTDKAMIPRLLPSGIEIGNKTGTDSEKLADCERTPWIDPGGRGDRYRSGIEVRRCDLHPARGRHRQRYRQRGADVRRAALTARFRAFLAR